MIIKRTTAREDSEDIIIIITHDDLLTIKHVEEGLERERVYTQKEEEKKDLL